MKRYRISIPLLLTTLLLASGCDVLTRYQLRGTYHRIGEKQSLGVNAFELTDSHLLMTLPVVGQRAFEYHLEGDRLYVGEGQQLQFTNEGYGILRNDGTTGFDGRFIKLKD
jgi:hypothetical protein